MSLSVIDPITPALARTKQILFQPFDLGKWLGLGFCAFLMSLGGDGGGGGSMRFNGSGFGNGGSGRMNGGDGSPNFDVVTDWIRDNLALVVVIAVAVFLVLFILGVLFAWLGGRGRFMFLDGVVHNRGAVVAPWHEYRREGNSFFAFRFCLGIFSLLLVALILGLSVLIAWPDIQGRQFGGAAVAAITAGVLMFIAFGLTMAVVSVLLTDFIAPIMYLRRIKVMAAWREFFTSMLAGNLVVFVLYFLMKIVIGIAVGIVAFVATCVTCCIATLPYIGAVVLLPLTVFTQAYTLCFIEQFGPSWRVFPADILPPAPDSPPPLVNSSIS